MKLRCDCGATLIVVDDNGSLGCSDECGREGLTIEPMVAELVAEEDIVWVGETHC